MSSKIRQWCDNAWQVIEQLPGVTSEEILASWMTHSKHESLVVTLFGPYDSGKSSLLKRLLVDGNQAIPYWLTVSGRRETFELMEVPLMGMTFRDIPGIAGGNENHSRLAMDAIMTTDIILIVLPPQLVTSEREVISQVLNGERFGCKTYIAFAPKGLPIILSRMDEAGAMPRDDMDGYRSLVRRKCEEFEDYARGSGVSDGIVSIFPLAADPFGLIGNAVPKDSAEYDADRNWDGIADLTLYLGEQLKNKDDHRLRSEVRFLGRTLLSTIQGLQQLSEEYRVSVESATNEKMSYELFEKKLAALLSAAKSDLDRCIEEEVSAATRRGAADVNEMRDQINGRLEETIGRWMNGHEAGLQSLLRELDAESKTRHERPSWNKFKDILTGKSVDTEPKIKDKKTKDVLERADKISKLLHKGFREIQPIRIGMSLEKAKDELARLQNLGSFEKYVEQTRKGAARLQDADHILKSKRAVLLDKGFGVAIPAILELAGIISDVWSDHKETQKRFERREALRKMIHESSNNLAEKAWELWRTEGLPIAVENVIKEAKTNIENILEELESKKNAVDKSLKSVEKCKKSLDDLSD